MSDLLADYDYALPSELIANEPAARRDDARLMVLHRRLGTIEHRTIRDLPDLLQPGDVLVLNDTRVLPARLRGVRVATGGLWQGLYVGSTPAGDWQLLGQTRGKLRPGERLRLTAWRDDSPPPVELVLQARTDEGIWTAVPHPLLPPEQILAAYGAMPLPPYLHQREARELDFERYQTVYARRPGAIAAPTAGLHLTDDLLRTCTDRGLGRVMVTLHVGLGTFKPIEVEQLSAHRMHREWCEVSADAVQQLEAARNRGGRIVCVGTTSLRTLESASRSGKLVPFTGETDLFIRPGHTFHAADVLLTNFHLPRSTLLVLVAALAGREQILAAYRAAIEARYRFFSYGDAMLIL